MASFASHQLSARFQGVPIGVKIFGITTSLLGLIVLVVGISTNRLRQVNKEIINLADYAIPITDRVAQIDVHVLEQELHFERVQTLYEIDPLDRTRVQAELTAFAELGEQVDEEMATAIALTRTAIREAQLPQAQAEWRRIEPQLVAIETEHQQFQDHAAELFELLATGQMEAAHRLEAQLIEEETNFNQSINDIFLELEAFTVEAAKMGQKHQQIVQNLSLSVAALATIFGLVYATLVTLSLVRPVRSLARGIAAVQAGNLDIHLDSESCDEVGTLAQAFNTMVNELKLKARLEETFGKYVDPRIVHTLMQGNEDTSTIGERQIMTVFFAHVEGIEDFFETLEPAAQVRFTNKYLSLMSAPITAHGGVIDKFIGTVIMGFWGPPFTDADSHARLACEAALTQIERLKQLSQTLNQATSHQPVPSQLHIGISTGSLVVGNMGSHTAKSYTVMGDTVNTASRLKGASKQYGVAVLINEEAQQQVVEVMATRELDLIQAVGKEEPTRIYELLGYQRNLSASEQTAYAAFARGLAAYRQQNWSQARQGFNDCLTQKPADPPALLYLERITQLEVTPPPADWNGVWQLTQK
ncbi:MAG: HAMP domain-containing protein [Leptolyngbya sp. SIO1D8]|nr:HAMP domain-containing protein [Leptolyngbya sp. SIO1D8]